VGSGLARVAVGVHGLQDVLHLVAHGEDVWVGAIDAGEADVGDGVQLAQAVHHQLADHPGLDLGAAELEDLVLDIFDQRLELADGDRALLAGQADTLVELLAVEWLAPAIGLDDHQLGENDTLDSAEALQAALAAAAPVDGAALIA